MISAANNQIFVIVFHMAPEGSFQKSQIFIIAQKFHNKPGHIYRPRLKSVVDIKSIRFIWSDFHRGPRFAKLIRQKVKRIGK